tara:strand:+ start:5257 stop:6408 length:1152 start_codon:yes stop_codon:yes gene_type:complete
MAIDFLHHINLNQNQIKSVVLDNQTKTNYEKITGVKGQVVFQSTDNLFKFYDGTNWITLGELSASDIYAFFSANDAGGDGKFEFDNTTGEFKYTGPSATEVRAHFSEGTGITLKDGEITCDITQYADSDVQAYLSGGTGVTMSASGEFSIGQAVGTTDDVTFDDITAGGDLLVKGAAVIKGNLTVEGTTTTVNQTQVNVENAFVFEGAKVEGTTTTLKVVEPTKNRVVNLPDGDGTIALTADIPSNNAIKDLVGGMVSGNTESGISATYDTTARNLDFDVDDFTVTLTGDVTGSGTVTDLGDVSFATTTVKNKAFNGVGPATKGTDFDVSHGLNTVNVVVMLVKGGQQVMGQIKIKDKDTVSIGFAKDQAADSITVNIISAAV